MVTVRPKMAKRLSRARWIATNMAWHTIPLRFRWLLTLMIAIGVTVLLEPVFVSAGPITNGAGNAPYTKLGVYQGLLTVAPVRSCVNGSNPGTSCPVGNECTGGGVCTAASILEVGNAGTDFAGSGEIYLRPGGLTRSAALRMYRNASNRSELFLSSGSLCLGSVSAATCRSTWPVSGGSGDTYWSELTGGPITYLQPSAAATPTVIRIGRPSSPIPSTSGRALEIYGSATPVANFSGYLETGTQTFDGNSNTYVYAGGNVLVTGNVNITSPDLVRGDGWLNNYDVYPYTNSNRYSGYRPTYHEFGAEGSINADTFDSATNLLFPSYYCRQGSNPGASCVNAAGNGPNAAACLGGGVCQKNDLQAISIEQSSGSYNGYLCLRTNASKLCVGGASNSNAGTPCPNGNECTGGATCTDMCSAQAATCAADPAVSPQNPTAGYLCRGGTRANQSCTILGSSSECPGAGGVCVAKRCGVLVGTEHTPGPEACSNSNDCASQVCMRGFEASQTGYASSFCSGLTCAQVCSSAIPVQRCNGQTGAGACNAFGTSVNYQTGTNLDISTTFYGSCLPVATGGWRRLCDCYNDTARTYYQAQPSGSGGLLCSDLFN